MSDDKWLKAWHEAKMDMLKLEAERDALREELRLLTAELNWTAKLLEQAQAERDALLKERDGSRKQRARSSHE